MSALVGAILVATTAALAVGLALLLGGFALTTAVAGGVVVGAVLVVVGRRSVATLLSFPPEGPRGAAEWSSELLLWFTVALALWKISRVPLWSWDHFAMWGLVAGHLDDPRGLVALKALPGARPELALPLLWRAVSPASWPAGQSVILAHVAMAVALIVLTRGLLRRLGTGTVAANLLAAWVAASPLYWDTIFVGVADLPLALWTALTLGLLIGAGEAPPAASSLAGSILGFLPWVKREGLPLALLLAAVGVGYLARSAPDRGAWPRIVRWIGTGGALIAVHVLLVGRRLPRGPDLFKGDWAARASSRDLLPIAGEMLRVALHPAWLGFWAAFGLIVLFTLRRGDRLFVSLALAVAAQLAIYGAVYLFASPDPLDHVRASFSRLLGALTPMAALAVGGLVARPRGEPVGPP